MPTPYILSWIRAHRDYQRSSLILEMIPSACIDFALLIILSSAFCFTQFLTALFILGPILVVCLDPTLLRIYRSPSNFY